MDGSESKKERKMGVLKMWRGKGGMIKYLNLVTAEFLFGKRKKEKVEKEKEKKWKLWKCGKRGSLLGLVWYYDRI
jgi:hypothetical protein